MVFQYISYLEIKYHKSLIYSESSNLYILSFFSKLNVNYLGEFKHGTNIFLYWKKQNKKFVVWAKGPYLSIMDLWIFWNCKTYIWLNMFLNNICLNIISRKNMSITIGSFSRVFHFRTYKFLNVNQLGLMIFPIFDHFSYNTFSHFFRSNRFRYYRDS